MEASSEPKTASEMADLDAFTALKQSAAIEHKEKGNEYVKMGKKHYSDAIDCYTKAINQQALSDSEQSIIFSNRAHTNLLLGNNRRALQDAEEAIKLCQTNIKALYRAAKASFSLGLLVEATSYCKQGLEQSSSNEDFKKLVKQIDVRMAEQERQKAEVSKVIAYSKCLIAAFDDRKLRIGKEIYQELTRLKRPMLDKNNILHWPVVVLYPEVMSSDLIQDFCEVDRFSAHLDMMFLEDCQPLTWDEGNAYTRDALEVYYKVGSEIPLPKKELLGYLLEGTAASNLENEGEGDIDTSLDSTSLSTSIGNDSNWVKVDERKTLHDVLKEPNHVIPGIPVFFIVSRKSSFYSTFKSGTWSYQQVV
ncbi:unnamed protein product [Cuscuta epithymum]|uniref:Cns1/TTC4 wheel domain-containing protein n=1 Tax=Cuscuta epithymum TaxID=186058 RepID=A0AAV0F1P8_9ASTE|nr:unnamed protein product [Cuscuta epithymum]